MYVVQLKISSTKASTAEVQELIKLAELKRWHAWHLISLQRPDEALPFAAHPAYQERAAKENAARAVTI